MVGGSSYDSGNLFTNTINLKMKQYIQICAAICGTVIFITAYQNCDFWIKCVFSFAWGSVSTILIDNLPEFRKP